MQVNFIATGLFCKETQKYLTPPSALRERECISQRKCCSKCLCVRSVVGAAVVVWRCW